MQLATCPNQFQICCTYNYHTDEQGFVMCALICTRSTLLRYMRLHVIYPMLLSKATNNKCISNTLPTKYHSDTRTEPSKAETTQGLSTCWHKRHCYSTKTSEIYRCMSQGVFPSFVCKAYMLEMQEV